MREDKARVDHDPLPSIGIVLDTLGEATLRLVSDPVGRDLAVTHTVLHDALGDLEEGPRGLLLVPGSTPDDPALVALLGDAADQGFSGVVVKARGQELTALADAADAAGLALLVVDDAVGWLHLDRMVSTALAGTGGSPGTALSSLAVGDLFSLANVIATTTGGATAIEDLGRRVLAYSTVPGQVIDDERRDGILGRLVPNLPDNDRQYAQVYATTGTHFFEATDTGLARLACAVRTGTDPLGSVWVVVPPEGAREDAEAMLAAAAEIAALHLLRSRSGEDFARQRRTDLVRRLLEQDDAAAARQLGLSDPAALSVVAIHAPPRPGTSSVDLARLLDVVSLELGARLGPSGCVVASGRVYALVTDAIGPERQRAGIAGAVRAAGQALRLQLFAGVSRTLPRAWQVSAARHEADRVVDLVLADPDLGPVGHAASLVDRLTLLTLADQHPDSQRLSLPAQALLAHDAETGQDLAALVLAWLESARDTAAVARRLDVHVNTVRYRLRRVEERFGIDLQNPDQTLLLWLALRLHQTR
ncbi:PucR family transcriptional regulator [Ornithinimicrobium panacihumi]|uniref:PucR family transcriptional regulator n=1 Tax=Ornithinimicrobium panacihumi TaxID=2008449 RepID=UPI003F8CD345